VSEILTQVTGALHRAYPHRSDQDHARDGVGQTRRVPEGLKAIASLYPERDDAATGVVPQDPFLWSLRRGFVHSHQSST
jgi:hypothetical protein